MSISAISATHATYKSRNSRSKPDYTKSNAYPPIALENTLGKVIESVVTESLSYTAETYSLTSLQHFDGRSERMRQEAMRILFERIYNAW